MEKDPCSIKRNANISDNVTITRRTKFQKECNNAQAIRVCRQLDCLTKVLYMIPTQFYHILNYTIVPSMVAKLWKCFKTCFLN